MRGVWSAPIAADRGVPWLPGVEYVSILLTGLEIVVLWSILFQPISVLSSKAHSSSRKRHVICVCVLIALWLFHDWLMNDIRRRWEFKIPSHICCCIQLFSSGPVYHAVVAHVTANNTSDHSTPCIFRIRQIEIFEEPSSRPVKGGGGGSAAVRQAFSAATDPVPKVNAADSVGVPRPSRGTWTVTADSKW